MSANISYSRSFAVDLIWLRFALRGVWTFQATRTSRTGKSALLFFMKLLRLPFANHMPTTAGFLLLFSLDLAADVPRLRIELFPKLKSFCSAAQISRRQMASTRFCR
jgi:hypothetical protein